jgi:hypothetical protein
MPRICLCCRHLKREELDARLLAGDSSTAVAEAYDVSHDSVSRHRHKHLAGPMVAAAEAALASLPDSEEARLEKARLALSVAHGSNLLVQLDELTRDASAIKSRAETKGELGTALAAVRELCRLVKLAAQLRGELSTGNSVNVGVFGGDPGSQPFTVAMVDQILRERSDRTGVEDDYSHFHTATEGWVREDFTALWEFCRERTQKRTSLLLDAASAPEGKPDDAEGHPAPDRGQNASTEGSNGH